MEHVIIGVDPQKLSATIEVVNQQEKLPGSAQAVHHRPGRLRGHAQVREDMARPAWAVEGANGTGRPLAQRLLEAGEHVVDVPAKLAARVRPSTPATTARPTPSTRTPSPSSRSAPPRFGS